MGGKGVEMIDLRELKLKINNIFNMRNLTSILVQYAFSY